MLIDEFETASRSTPGLVKAFAARDFMELEESGGEALARLFREHGEPGFLVARDMGGAGGSLLEMTQVLRVVGARCPSLAIMMTMHHHTVATFSKRGIVLPGGEAFLARVAGARALVASAFAEGRPGGDVLDSTVRCIPLGSGGGFKVVGAKKPCSMTHHADLAVVGVSAELEEGETCRGIALVDTGLEGVGTSAFWPADVLASADCHCLTFDGVIVPEGCVLAPRGGGRASSGGRLAVAYAEIAMSSLFQLMASASYLGMASRLAEIVLKRRGGTPAQRVDILRRLEAAVMSVYWLAERLEKGRFSGYLLAQSMLVARNASAQIERAAAASTRALGGSGYLGSREARYLLVASRCLDFHPPTSGLREEIVDSCYTDQVRGEDLGT